jgi:acetoin utilization protein AcuB
MPVHDVLAMFKNDNIRRAPVIKKGKMVGIVSDSDLLNASLATTLSVWEINSLLSKVTVKHVMTKKVKTIEMDTPIEEAARIMADFKIGGMPVTQKGKIVGMITATDLFKVLLELTGAREKGVRATILIEDKLGEIAKVSKSIAEAGGNIIAVGMYAGPEVGKWGVIFKVLGIKKEAVKAALDKTGKKLVDIR